VHLPDCRACHIGLGMHFVAQQALCNALGASGLHWVWAIDAASGSRLSFQDGRGASISRHVGRTHAFSLWAMADLILLREWLTVRLPASIATTGLFAAGDDASGKTKARD
jgi:hypothetical protein